MNYITDFIPENEINIILPSFIDESSTVQKIFLVVTVKDSLGGVSNSTLNF